MKQIKVRIYTIRFVRYATEHRCGVVVRGPKLSSNISGTDPLKDNRRLIDCYPLDDTDSAKFTSDLINALSDEFRRRLSSHPINQTRISQEKKPANVILLRGCGQLFQAPTFQEKHGLHAAMIAPTKIIAGVGHSLKINVVPTPGATGDYRTSLTSKALTIARVLSLPSKYDLPDKEDHNYDAVTERKENEEVKVAVDQCIGNKLGDPIQFGFLHIKAVDDAGHDKASHLKIRLLENVDRMIGQLARLLWTAERDNVSRFCLLVTGDHSTPVLYGDHSFEPVPFVICHLSDFVKIKGQDEVMNTDLDPISLPLSEEEAADSLSERLALQSNTVAKLCTVGNHELLAWDLVSHFNEVEAASGGLGRFSGCEMMNVVKSFATSASFF